jgi:hypothetical protein
MDGPEALIVYSEDRRTQLYLLRTVRCMTYGDALTMPGFRLEYRQPRSGLIHYMLVRTGKPVGVQYVKAASWLDEVQQKLSVYLTILGFNRNNTNLRAGGARVPLYFEHDRLPLLFKFEAQHKQADIDDELFGDEQPDDSEPIPAGF